jgi:demethoxyubiquinone hydroxylase (CLK1/Coq7/Cat5 family)
MASTDNDDRRQLVGLLRGAYSGELAAAYAYRGHWKSVERHAERERIRQIEDEEWVHRERVGAMLCALSAAPARTREARMWLIGRALGFGCHLIGWFLPMYFAGRLESMNVREYETAAFHARNLGLFEFAADLQHMATVEGEHEIFFRQMVTRHRWLPLMRRVFGWS